MDKIIRNLYEKNFCNLYGKGCRKKGWIKYPDEVIIIKYNYIIRGLRNYYSPADNLGTSMNRLQYILKYSCAHTLASKHRTRISTQQKRLKSLGLDIKYSKLNPWNFKGTSLTPNKLLYSYVNRTKILTATNCIICESQDNLEVHHLKALRKDGVNLQDKYFRAVMQRMNRKQIAVCRKCHQDIHNGVYNGVSLKILERKQQSNS